MAIGLEEDEVAEEPKWHQDSDIELDEMCAVYREHEYRMKGYELQAKEEREHLQSLAEKIQAKMGQHKAVRTSAGYTVEWKAFQRKGYTVAASEGERWQLRSPF